MGQLALVLSLELKVLTLVTRMVMSTSLVRANLGAIVEVDIGEDVPARRVLEAGGPPPAV